MVESCQQLPWPFSTSREYQGGKQRFTAPGPGDWALRILATPVISNDEEPASGLSVQNGWYVEDGKAIWGYGQHNGWWRPGQRPNLARNAPGEIGQIARKTSTG